MKLIKVAIIGAGKIAEEHIKAFKAIKKTKIVGIFSRTESKAIKLKNKYKISKVYKNIDNMYLDSLPDLVIVAVSILSAREVLKKVSKYEWYCLCEKPIGINYQETLIISKFFKNRNKFFIAFNRRHYDSTLLAQRILKKDNSKRLILINDQEDIIQAKKFHPSVVCKNFMYANSIHLVDYCQIFARGSPKKFISLTKIKDGNFSFFSKKIVYDSGDIVIFSSIWNRPGPWFVKLITKNIFINLEPLENIKYTYRKGLNNVIKSKSKNIINYNSITLKNGFYTQAYLCIESILKKKILLPTLNDAISTTHLIKQIFSGFTLNRFGK